MIREPVAICSWLMLAAVALRPGASSPPSGATRLVSAAVYFLAAALTRYWLQDTRSRLQILVFVGLAALLEAVRYALPNRAPSLANWIWSASGAVLGVLTVKWILEGTLL